MSTELLHCHSSFLLLNYSQSYLLNTTYQWIAFPAHYFTTKWWNKNKIICFLFIIYPVTAIGPYESHEPGQLKDKSLIRRFTQDPGGDFAKKKTCDVTRHLKSGCGNGSKWNRSFPPDLLRRLCRERSNPIKIANPANPPPTTKAKQIQWRKPEFAITNQVAQ